MSERRFPVLRSYTDEAGLAPHDVPWSLVAPHARQAKQNHGGQTLERLAKRGGLSPCELYYVLRDEPWPRDGKVIAPDLAIAATLAAIRAALTTNRET